MSMVLEHLYYPFESLENITYWLKPGGQLIFSIPYFEGFEFRFLKNILMAYNYFTILPFLIKKYSKLFEERRLQRHKVLFSVF